MFQLVMPNVSIISSQTDLMNYFHVDVKLTKFLHRNMATFIYLTLCRIDKAFQKDILHHSSFFFVSFYSLVTLILISTFFGLNLFRFVLYFFSVQKPDKVFFIKISDIILYAFQSIRYTNLLILRTN